MVHKFCDHHISHKCPSSQVVKTCIFIVIQLITFHKFLSFFHVCVPRRVTWHKTMPNTLLEVKRDKNASTKIDFLLSLTQLSICHYNIGRNFLFKMQFFYYEYVSHVLTFNRSYISNIFHQTRFVIELHAKGSLIFPCCKTHSHIDPPLVL